MTDRRLPARLGDADLEAALRDLGAALAVPSVPSVASGAGDPARVARLRIEAGPTRSWWAPAARSRRRPLTIGRGLVLALIAVVAIAAIAGAIGFGLPGIRFVPAPSPSATPTPASTPAASGIGPSLRPTSSPSPRPTPTPPSTGPLGSALGLGDAIPLDRVASAVDFPLVLPPAEPLGAPATAWLLDGRLSLVWPTGPDLPPLGEPRLGLILSEFRGTVNPGYFEKIIGPGTTVEPVTVDGLTGWWVSGAPHEIVYINASQQPVFDSRRIVGDTLLWSRDGLTYRLETSLGRAGAVALAETLR
jgi:hypothetical protein